MRLKQIQFVVFFFVGIWVWLPLHASDMLETDDFKDVHAKALELGEKHGTHAVLLVFDVDNTLLAADHDLGSDQWYEWQSHLLKTEPKSPHLVANQMNGLLDTLPILFTLGDTHATQSDLPELVKDLQERGFPSMVLTARSPRSRDATMRELKDAGLDFTKNNVPVRCGSIGVSAAFDPSDIEGAGVSRVEASRYGLHSPRSVSYDEGVMMVSGQHKGAMLLAVLAQATRHYTAIIFVDDKAKNTQNVFVALANRGIETYTFRYGREDENVEAFLQRNKDDVTLRWRQLNTALQNAFPNRDNP